MSYTDIGNEDLTFAALEGLKDIFNRAGKNLNKFPYQLDATRGQVTIEGDSFTYSSGHLRLVGVCPVCGLEVNSKPVRRLADVIDLKRNFRAEKHECFDN